MHYVFFGNRNICGCKTREIVLHRSIFTLDELTGFLFPYSVNESVRGWQTVSGKRGKSELHMVTSAKGLQGNRRYTSHTCQYSICNGLILSARFCPTACSGSETRHTNLDRWMRYRAFGMRWLAIQFAE